MQKQIDPKIIAQYNEPLRYAAEGEIREAFKREKRTVALLIIAGLISLAVWASVDVPFESFNVSSRPVPLWVALPSLGFGLPLYGLYRFVHIKHYMKAEFRRRLLETYPAELAEYDIQLRRQDAVRTQRSFRWKVYGSVLIGLMLAVAILLTELF